MKEAGKVIDGVQVEVITSQIIKLSSQEGDETGPHRCPYPQLTVAVPLPHSGL